MLIFQHSGRLAPRILLLVALFAANALAQPPAFDVASLKPVPPALGDYRANLGSALHGEVMLTNATLGECLRFAFDINNDDQIAGPDWIKSRQVRFDIVAKAPPDTPVPQLRLMLRTLLIERFKLVLHHEQREMSHLALVVAKNGPKFHSTGEDSDPSGNTYINGRIVSDRLPMFVLSLLLSRYMHQPVLDFTGLKGSFVVSLRWAPEGVAPPAISAGNADTSTATDPAAGMSIFEALSQLGLSLERRKGPLEVVVVDHAEHQPIEN
jgi:uncharacterized protein (TIGR03435 family)